VSETLKTRHTNQHSRKYCRKFCAKHKTTHRHRRVDRNSWFIFFSSVWILRVNWNDSNRIRPLVLSLALVFSSTSGNTEQSSRKKNSQRVGCVQGCECCVNELKSKEYNDEQFFFRITSSVLRTLLQKLGDYNQMNPHNELVVGFANSRFLFSSPR
jgi:hypothetical protein